MAKLYFGGTLIGGDVEQADLDALQAEVDAVEQDLIDHKTANAGEHTALDNKITANENSIVNLNNDLAIVQEEVSIIANAAVAGRFLLGNPGDPGSGQITFAPDATDWTGTTTIKMHKIDNASHNFTYTNINVEDIIQAGSANGKGMFRVKAVNDISGTWADLTVEVLTASAGHVVGEEVSVTVGSEFDPGVLADLIADNTSAIGANSTAINALDVRVTANEGDIADLDTELQRVEGITSSNDLAIQALDAEIQTKFDTGTTTHGGTRLFASAGQIEDAVVKNSEDILALSTGGNPAVDDLVDEMPKKVENYNYSHPGEGDGVKTIRVTSTYSTLTADPNTLYVVI